MKKLLAILFAMVFVFSLSLVTFAAKDPIISPVAPVEDDDDDNGKESPKTGDFAVVCLGAIALASIPMAVVSKKQLEK